MRVLLMCSLILAACGEDPIARRLDLCARGDRALLEEALADGTLTVRILQGDELVAESTGPAGAATFDIDLPDGEATVTIEGRSAEGDLVARGEGTLGEAGGCVCLALDAQSAAACGGMTCQLAGEVCRFTDDATGAPAGRQELDLASVLDTWLDDADPDAEHANDDTLSVAAGATALLRFDLSALPLSATIERAELRLVRADAASDRPLLHRVTGAWDATATAGDPPPLDALTIAAEAGGGDGLTYVITDDVARWVSAPGENDNHGVALTLTTGASDFNSAEASESARPELHLEYSIEAMGLLEAGVFERGCPAECDADEETGTIDGCGCDEQPVHEVELSEFEIDRTEVTQAAYRVCVEAGECDEVSNVGECVFDPDRRPNYPVACASWEQAARFCEYAGKRLPTEAEWERAARGSSTGRYPWGDAPATCELTNSFYCTPGDIDSATRHAVGSHPQGGSVDGSVEIALDMAGNMWEWVADVYDADLYAELADEPEPPLDPLGPSDGGDRVRRGGYFFSGEWILRTGNRDHLSPDVRFQGNGFRCAR